MCLSVEHVIDILSFYRKSFYELSMKSFYENSVGDQVYCRLRIVIGSIYYSVFHINIYVCKRARKEACFSNITQFVIFRVIKIYSRSEIKY